MSTVEQISKVVSAPLRAAGFGLEELTVTPAGSRRLVRVFVDRAIDLPDDDETSPIAPLSLDEVAAATRVVDAALDAQAPFGELAYTLEVSSLGLTRPLTAWRHFRRNVGRLVALVTPDGPVTGRIVAVGADEIEIADPGDGKRPPTTVRLPLARIRKAHVQVEFGHIEEDED